MDQQQGQRKAIIGPSIQVKGELIGNEDLVIEGRVEGVVRLKEHHLTVGKSAQVQATLEAKAIRVEGTVQGDIMAGERVELAAGSTVVGDIVAPRIIISDGARFKGTVDMDHGPAPTPIPPGRPGGQSERPAATPAESERKPVAP
jgi:cytoskeletal protein CcmA (bactofilin family)